MDHHLKLAPMIDTIRKQRDQLQRLAEALTDIEELVDGYIDINNHGGPNLAMQVFTVIQIAKGNDYDNIGN